MIYSPKPDKIFILNSNILDILGYQQETSRIYKDIKWIYQTTYFLEQSCTLELVGSLTFSKYFLCPLYKLQFVMFEIKS